MYTYSTGTKQHLYVNKPELIKEMNQSMTMDLGKPTYSNKSLAPMLGNGVLRSNGPFWAQQRKIIAPEFFMDKVKVRTSYLRTSLAKRVLCQYTNIMNRLAGHDGADGGISSAHSKKMGREHGRRKSRNQSGCRFERTISKCHC